MRGHERYEVSTGRSRIRALTPPRPFPTGIFPDRFLPDKAIDLVDEGLRHGPHRDRFQRRLSWTRFPKIMQLEIEEAALKKETDALFQEHLQEPQKSWRSLPQFKEMKAKWENEKEAAAEAGEIDQVNGEIERRNAATT